MRVYVKWANLTTKPRIEIVKLRSLRKRIPEAVILKRTSMHKECNCVVFSLQMRNDGEICSPDVTMRKSHLMQYTGTNQFSAGFKVKFTLWTSTSLLAEVSHGERKMEGIKERFSFLPLIFFSPRETSAATEDLNQP